MANISKITLQNGTTYNIKDATTRQTILTFTNVTVNISKWVSDSTYADYPYHADISCTNVTANHIPTVNFSLTDATSGTFAPIALSGSGYVRIYASGKPTSTVTIPSIVCEKGA